MQFETIDLESQSAWQWARRFLRLVWGWANDGDNPYSPLFCLALLLVVGLLVKLAH